MGTIIEWILLIIAVIVALIYVSLIWNFNFWKKRGIKGPTPKVLYGNTDGMFSKHLVYDLDRIYKDYKGKEPFVGFFLSRQPRLLIIDPKLIREILISNFKSFNKNQFLFPVDKKVEKLIGENPFLLEGAEWKEKRAEITPALTANRIKASYSIISVVCRKLSKFIESEYENPPKDGIEAKEEKEIFFTNLMRDAVKLREQTKDDRVDFLNYIIQLRDKKNISELVMAAHSLSFFLDGFETSSILISHTIHMLAKHKDVQEKLRAEIRAAVSEDGSLPFEKLSDIPYLDCVINETLRLFPPGPFLWKYCTESTEFTNSEGKPVLIEKDMQVILPLFSIHRDPEYYENADKFIPERFSEENGGVKKYRDANVFFPFGDGPRICLGMRFALTQSKAVIAELAKNWEMTVNKKTKPGFVVDPQNMLTLKDGGIWVNFKKVQESKKNV